MVNIDPSLLKSPVILRHRLPKDQSSRRCYHSSGSNVTTHRTSSVHLLVLAPRTVSDPFMRLSIPTPSLVSILSAYTFNMTHLVSQEVLEAPELLAEPRRWRRPKIHLCLRPLRLTVSIGRRLIRAGSTERNEGDGRAGVLVPLELVEEGDIRISQSGDEGSPHAGFALAEIPT